jgi:tetratricopeptide (TPR) repeat protein/tRNA A-37 threonylcarbamoyl transferase component Bud32
MNPERWQRIEEIFGAAADCPPAEREDYLTRACGDDAELRREALELLAHDTADSFIDNPIKKAVYAVTAAPPDEPAGQRIGPYRLMRLIGRGGMGEVYEAVRDDDEFQHRVAIKLIKRGMESDFVRERFLRERRILGSLDHPHIARLLDGGATAEGRPYFVMEFVAGEAITAYCDRRPLPLDEKLQLFRDVCSAVQHAHCKLVIHRDLKPGNILVTEDGAPKLLDFGIAKLFAPDPGEAVTGAESTARLMTPDYASPEQLRGDAITTATDVYSLGVVLYELLTARRPYKFETCAPLEIARVICDTEAPRPSEAARMHTAAPAKLARRLAGDLDNIVLMALRKEPERRYQSVEQFSEDIRRHLAGLPVMAREDTLGYRATKFMGRHKAGVAALVLLAALTVALAMSTVRIGRERDRANQAAATAEAVTQSLVSVFEFADPGQSRVNTIMAKELLDRGAAKVVLELKDQPLVQAKLMDTIGELYLAIGAYDRAQPLLADALELRRRTVGAERLDVAESLHHLATVAYEKGDHDGSETMYREALQLRRSLLGAKSLKAAASMAGLGRVLVARGKFAEAEPLVRDALALRRSQLEPEHKDIADSLLHGLGRLLGQQGKFAEAADVYRQALAIYRKLYGEENSFVAASLNNLAVMLKELTDYRGAEALFRKSLAMRRKLLGEEHPDVAASLANLASLLQDKREYAEAEQCYRQALLLRRKLFGENRARLAATMNNLATLLAARGDYAGSEALHRHALAICRKEWGEDHAEVGTSLYNLANLFYLKGQPAEAEKWQRQAIAVYQKTLQPEHWMIQRSRSHLGACLFKLKRFREAEEQLLPAYAGLKITRGARHALTRQTASHLRELYEAEGKTSQAALYRK